MNTIYYTTTNNGDGSSSVEFFAEQELIDMLEDHNPETYAGGEGGGSFQFTGLIHGIDIRSRLSVERELRDEWPYDNE